jgi:lysophospholipase L1-like esterase
MYRFQVIAHTQVGESIGLVGSTPELGQWDSTQCIRLHTSAEAPPERMHQRYPLWWVDLELGDHASIDLGDRPRIEYKYVRFGADGSVTWEAWGTNRWVPLESEPSSTIIVDDGLFGSVQPYPYGYFEQPAARVPLTQSEQGLKIVVLGSSVALGCSTWLLNGWAQRLEQVLHQRYGHQVVNVSALGANVTTTIARFPEVVAPEQPDVVIIALSLGNEGFANCAPHERRAVQRRFESGLQQLIKMTRSLGARPVLGSVYPNGNYTPEHHALLQSTYNCMLSWGVPVLDWLAAVDDGQGRWKAGTSFDPAHPNSLGHRLMFQSIALELFQIDKAELAKEVQHFQQPQETLVYLDDNGFQVTAWNEEKRLTISNPSPYQYTLAPYWQELQTALQRHAKLLPGLYLAASTQPGMLPYLSVQVDGAIATTIDISPGATLEYSAASNFFVPQSVPQNNPQVLFDDGFLALLKAGDRDLWVINEAGHEYNIQPMWQVVRHALKALPPGVYDDPLHPDAPFRTLIIGNDGLESRVKAPPHSAILFQFKCELSEMSRVAILPLGDRCAVRMMLYKIQYDGPAFPFDLTRTTQISDVADMIENRFQDMWNPAFLHYSPDAGRIYHRKWTGLSFAHEIEDTDDPINDLSPVHERMRTRYTARAGRFWYALQHCDKVLFIRTGISDRGGVIDLVNKLQKQCQDKPFHLLLLSPQCSQEFADLPNVLHYDLEFNPDRMYDDLGHWMYCTKVMHGILESLGISSKNLFWCPPNPPTNISSGR